MAHFTQRTKEITGGLQAWHRRHGDVSANNQMQICHLQRSRGQGRTRSSESERTQVKKHFTLQDQNDTRMTTPARRGGEIKTLSSGAAESTSSQSERSGGLLSLVAHVGLLKCHVLLHISCTLTTGRETGQGSVWWRQAICRTVSARGRVGDLVAWGEAPPPPESHFIRTQHIICIYVSIHCTVIALICLMIHTQRWCNLFTDAWDSRA